MTNQRDEFLARQQRLCRCLQDSGLGGAIVISRGGYTYDRSADVLYLTNHYQGYVCLPENPPHWSGRAYTIFVLRSDGSNSLCISTPEIDHTSIVSEETVSGENFIATVVQSMKKLGMVSGDVGVIGSDVITKTLWDELESEFDNVNWVDCSELLSGLRRKKSPAEISLIRQAASINRHAASVLIEKLRPGNRESDAVAAAASVISGKGAALYFSTVSSGKYSGFYASKAMPGFSTRTLEVGDLVRFDLGTVYQGYYSDFGRTIIVGDPDPDQIRLITTLHAAIDETIGAIKPGVSVKQVVNTGNQALLNLGVSMDEGPAAGQICASYPAHWGHGLGLGWERPWMTADEDLVLDEGMYLAIERALTLDGTGTAAAEQNVLVTESGVELLTGTKEGDWK